MQCNQPSIRLAGAADAAAMATIYTPFVLRSAISFESEPPTTDEFAARLSASSASSPWLVCTIQENVVGFAYAGAHRSRAAYQWSVETSVYVHSTHHRRGVGRALYTSLLNVLRVQGFFRAHAGITLPNPASVHFHEGVGFSPIGTYEKVGFKQGQWHDVGWWALQLQPQAAQPDPPLAVAAALDSHTGVLALASGITLLRPSVGLNSDTAHCHRQLPKRGQ